MPERIILLIPLIMMAGIGTYFALPQEPPPQSGLRMVLAMGALVLVTRRTRVFWPVLLFAPAVVGFGLAQIRAEMVRAPLLSKELRFVRVEGTIDEIGVTEDGARLVLARPAIEGVTPEQTPARVRIAFRGYDRGWLAGDRVRVKATLMPLPGPAQPGAFDFARYFYFERIGAVGYATSLPEVIEPVDRSGFALWLSHVRHRAADDLRAAIPGAAGAVAAAVTVGEEGGISKEAAQAMRDSGLSHILSISGLHLALASGIVFYIARLLLSLWPRAALRLPVKKVAAVVALMSAFAYLLLAGAPVPAQRSFIMVGFVLLAMLIDRKGISLHSLAWAAIMILLFLPESMLGASFQMSFAATLSIVALYGRFGRLLYRRDMRWWQRPLYVLLGVAATSLAATLATSPFVIYHFNRFSTWGLIANMLVTPLTSFLIMPGVVLVLALLPLGLQHAAYPLLGLGVKGMLWIAEWTAALPLAAFSVPAPGTVGFLFAVAGFLWLMLSRSRFRIAGIALMALGLGSAALRTPPDLLINDSGTQVMARDEDGTYVMLKGNGRSFVAQAWLRSLGQENPVSGKDRCKQGMCAYEKNGKLLLYVDEIEALSTACHKKPDALLTRWRLKPDECPGVPLLIDRRVLDKGGSHVFHVSNQYIKSLPTWESSIYRPWNKRYEPAGF